MQIDGFIDKDEFKKQIDEWIQVFRITNVWIPRWVPRAGVSYDSAEKVFLRKSEKNISHTDAV